MAELGQGEGGPALHDARHGLGFGKFPTHGNALGRQAIARFQWLGAEAGPEHDAVGLRITAGDAQLEGVGGERDLGVGRAGGPGSEGWQRRQGRTVGDEEATAESALVADGLRETFEQGHGCVAFETGPAAGQGGSGVVTEMSPGAGTSGIRVTNQGSV